ncbi:3-hydroxyacyl-ACP dehydratase FabZ family protein [Saccharothrix isguenensis]
MIDADGIRAVLPHRPPMLLVDRVEECVDGVSIRAVRRVEAAEPWFAASGAPVADAYPQALMLESWAQTAGVLVTKESPNPDVLSGTVMLFGSASGVEYHGRVTAGQVMEHHVTIGRVIGDSVVAGGKTVVDGETVMTVDQIIMMFQPASVLRPQAVGKEESHA